MKHYSNLIIDSRERNSSSSASSSDFTIYLYSSFTNINQIRLNWIQIPNTLYNINSSNNIVSFTENLTLKTATIPSGNYNALDLASELASILTTASEGYNVYTVTYSTKTFMLSFTASAHGFQLNCSKANFPYHELGFALTDTSLVTSLTSLYVVSLEQPTEIIISINQFDKMVTTGSTQYGSTFIILNNVAQGDILSYQPDGGVIEEVSDVQTFKSLRIRLLDRYTLVKKLQ